MARIGRSRPVRSYTLVRPVTIFAPTLVAQADAGGAVDAQSVAVAAPMADVAAAVESMAIAVTEADVAAAVDALAAAVTAPMADVAAAADSMSVAAAAPSADVAGAVDSVSLLIGPQQADAAGAVEAMTETVTAPQADVAGAADKLVAAVAAPQADVAGAADKLAIGLPIGDAAGAVDSMAIGLPVADAAGAVDSMVEAVAAPQHDVAGAVDSMSVSTAGAPTLSGTLPAIVLAYLPPGYQGGPSGAGHVVPSALGNSWEIQVRSAADYSTLLAVIPGSMLMTYQFVRQLNDIGSGTVVLSQDDPWWSAVHLPGGLPTETLLDDECLWQVYKDGVCRFEFLGETVTEQLVDPSEQRIVTITGPGTIAALKWAMVAPQGFPNIVLKLDGLLDSFDEVDVNGNGVIDTNIWTTISPAGHVKITPVVGLFTYPGGVGYNLGTLMPSGSLTVTASPSTTFLGAAPYDFTDTLISAQIAPIGVAGMSTDATNPLPYGTGLDGSELNQFYVQSNSDPGNYALWGLSATAFYAQLGGSGEVVTAYVGAGSYNSQTHAYWMITEQAGSGGGPGTFYWWTSSDGQNWSLWWQAVHQWDATNMTFFVTAQYDVDNTQALVLSNLNSIVTTPSYQGEIYLGRPMMGIWSDQLRQAQARGTIRMVTSTLTAAGDTYGRPWTDVQNVQTVNGTDLYTLLQSATSVVDADFVMDPGFQLRVGQPAVGQVGLGVDRSGYLILREGYDFAALSRVRARNQITTLLGGENADGHEISASSPTFITEWGQREAWFQAAVQVDPTSMAYAAAAALAENETEVLSFTLSVIPNLPGKTIFDNFDVGDWIGLERPDFSAIDPVRVVGIAVGVDSTGVETHELTVISYIQYVAEKLTYLANKLGGAFVNATGTTPVAPSKYGTGQVPTYFTPAATLGSLADVSSAPANTAANAPLVYNPVTGSYQPAGSNNPVTNQPVPVTVTGPGGSSTITLGGTGTTIVVNTGGGSTTVGQQPDGGVTSVDSGGTAPLTPDLPVVSGIVQGLIVTWDGLLQTFAPLSNFMQVNVYVGTSSGFTPGPGTLMGTLVTGGTLTVSGLTTGTTYYAKLVALSTSGTASPATTGVSGVAAGLPSNLLTGQLPASLIGNSAGDALNPNPFFNGGDLTGWTVVNGSLAAVAPPAGAPGAAQFSGRVTATSANCLINGSTAPFPTTPGQPYAMTAWVYNPGGSATSVAVGFNWTAGTTTVSVPPTVWTPVVAVMTCPGGVTSAYQEIGPVSSGAVIYVIGAVASAQVPGQLIAAGSIVGNQLVANTITATQIAAATITAGQIAANTITAAQIAANTITAAQIAAGTITATQISAGIILAGVVDGTTISGATFIAHGTAGEILCYSGTPASGNLIMSFASSAGTDSLGNSFIKGLSVGIGTSSTPQVQLLPAPGGPGSAAVLQFTLSPTSFFSNQPNIQGLSPSSTGEMLINGPALSQAGFTDWVQDEYFSFAGGGSTAAHKQTNYIDPSGNVIPYVDIGYFGTHFGACSQLSGVHPGTGTGNTNTAVAETWQTMSLINGWAGTGGLNGVRYQWTPLLGGGMVYIEGDIINSGGAGANSICGVLASGYRPPVSRNVNIIGWNNPQGSNSASAPWLFVDTSGNVQITGLQVGTKEVFFQAWLPMT